MACTSSGSEDAGTKLDGHSGSLALLSIERFVDSESLPRLVTSAKLARYRGIDGEVLLELLGAEARDGETCGLEGGFGQLSLAPQARVELVSVGDIALRLGDSATTLSPRLFPALASTASGFFYAGDAEMVPPRAELDEYVVSAHGEAGVGAFELVAQAPSEPLGLSIAGVRIELGPLTVSRDRELVLTWDSEDPRDRIELEIYAAGSVLSCATRDDGYFVLPAEHVSTLEADDNASVLARRVRVVPMDVQGIEAGYARIATTRTFAALVR